MAMVLDAVAGKVLDELLNVIVEKKERAVKFRPTLERLEGTLKSIEPLAKQIDGLNKRLDRPPEETEKLIEQMKKGTKLVKACSKVQWWNCCNKANYQEELEELEACIDRFFKYDMQGQTNRNVLEALVVIKDVHADIRNFAPRRSELSGVCLPPEPPAFTVGLDVHLRELKLKLLHAHHVASVLTVTGTGGSGKSTLAKKFCWDQDVKGKFKENIFFITFAKSPKLNTIVQRLFQHTGYQTPEFQSDDDMIYQLEHLLKKIVEKSPILLVLDDVWPKSVSLVDKFVFQIPNYTILVTSRFAIGEFGPPYVLKPLDETNAIKLLRHSASLDESRSDIPDDVVKKIVRGCSGSPLALRVNGRSLSHKQALFWHNRAQALSTGHSIIVSSDDVLTCLQKSFEDLDPKVAECFRDLSLFPEAQRIPAAALVDIWAELREEDDGSAMEKIYELVNRNMADIVVTRNTASDTIDYNYHYVTQHGLLRDLAILQTSQEPTEKRNRLIIDLSGNNLPEWWTSQNEYHIAASTLSISTDEAFTSEWCNLQPTEVEVLVLNLREKKHTLPMFMKKMNKLKVLIITNYDFYRAELENFELLDYLSDLKRIRLEKVSIPFLSKTGVQLKNLQKFSFFMCNMNEAFKNSTIKISDVLPNLEEMNIDYCDMLQLPNGLSDIVSLKRLSITNCHKLSALPEGIGKLVNLESLRLTSCTSLEELPDSITGLQKLKFLDISDCVSLVKLPENMGELSSLERLNYIGCTRLNELPYSVTELGGLRVVVCDEMTTALWEPFRTMRGDIKLDVTQVDFNLNWLL
ncbi:probable disease resistance protein At5g66900 [Cajanus cajan]|uniref:probable disease resistance protein At5g66900 n=1 Tax=Cajanus cajan TaxID=3821 RepID=UPI00098DA282|nr:probable disease resistance protein At5g66900 [Cajanus cajan]XP_020238614.1 probable disease resistance protein At5g66900 [Cajanus cajan]